MTAFNARLLGAASFFPERIVSNFDLEKLVDTSDEWITSRTGIKTRRFAKVGETCSDLAYQACIKLLHQLNKSPEEIEGILLATVTPDTLVPSSACILQKRLRATNAWACDVSAACSGFIYVLAMAEQFIKTGKIRNCLVIGSEVMSSILDMQDRTTCVLFGDGAAAVYLEASREPVSKFGIVDTLLKADGSGANLLYMEAGGSRCPATHDSVEKRLHYVRQDGQAVFKVAVLEMAAVSEAILKRNNLTTQEIKHFIPHQANLRIIEACAKRMDLKPEQIVINLDRYGNTTAATIPTCLAELEATKRIKPGDLVLMSAFGAGFTSAAALARWG